MVKSTHLLRDDPASRDDFGTHNQIAELISKEILDSDEGRSIALVGDWGSGKSTVIELLKATLAENGKSPCHTFIYDAWAHQGDSLRRAFLDDFIASLTGKFLNAEQAKECTEQVWNRVETTETTTEPVLRRHAKLLLLLIVLVPLGMKLFELPKAAPILQGLVAPNNLIAYPFLLAPLIGVIILRWSATWAVHA